MTPCTQIIPGYDIPTVVFAKNQPEYLQLPAYLTDEGVVHTRWKLSWRERIRIFLTGSLWLAIATFNKSLQPVRMSTQCTLSIDKEQPKS